MIHSPWICSTCVFHRHFPRQACYFILTGYHSERSVKSCVGEMWPGAFSKDVMSRIACELSSTIKGMSIQNRSEFTWKPEINAGQTSHLAVSQSEHASQKQGCSDRSVLGKLISALHQPGFEVAISHLCKTKERLGYPGTMHDPHPKRDKATGIPSVQRPNKSWDQAIVISKTSTTADGTSRA